MNKNLQEILDIIQQSEKLDAEQKDNLLKAVKDTDKELEITNFKLERTEKVKKTTAILLEETIEELEQKRKAVEKQNRELEIETALEKVRTIAMGMREPDDMLDVCKTISLQLESLGVKEIRNVQTAIFYEQRGNYMNYEYYTKHDKTFITETTFTNHEIHQEFATKMLKGKGEFFITHIKGNDVKDWIAYQKTTNVFIDTFLDTASSLNYYWFSLGPVALGISTYHPLTEEETNLFKRFLKVFELAYRRYMDIEKAEAQAREAQIELGLERVRARAMAMQNSNELSELVDTVFKELTKLDFALSWCIINIIDESSLSNMVWAANPNIDKAPDSYHMKFEDYPFHDAMMKGYKERAAKYIYVLEGIEKKVYDEYLFKETEFRKVPEEAQAASKAMEKYVCSFTFSNFGGLQTVGDKPLSDINLDILARFGKVFDLTYTRFNDLKIAEAQAREAQIEAALERVRSRMMAMHRSDELAETTAHLFDQLNRLGIKPYRCNIGIIDQEHESCKIWSTTNKGEVIPSVTSLPLTETPSFNNIYKAWKNKQIRLIIKLIGEERVIHTKYVSKFGIFNEYMPGTVNLEQISNEAAIFSNFFFKQGFVFVHSVEELSEADLNIIQRFTNVFEQTYTRFLDLQKAEEQAREANIEVALEKVRSRTMGMQKSEELKEVIQLVYDQFVHLNINIEHTGFIMDYKEREDMHIWLADRHEVPSEITIPYFDSPHWNSFNEAKEKGIDFFANYLTFEEKNKFYRDLFKLIPGVPDETLKYYFGCPGLAVSTVLLENVGLYIENFSGIPYSDEENDTLMRFGKVFQQTYTRFNDLKQAEAQARESQIEASLERVRTVAMSMNKSDDLLSICEVSFKEFQKLGFDNLRNTIIHILNDEKGFFLDYDFSDAMGGSISNIDYNSHPVVEDYLKQIKSARDAFAEVVIEHNQLNDWRDFRKKSGQRDDPRLESIPALHYYFHSIGVGDIGISTFKPIDESQIKILKRFRNVFDLAYRRYTDITKAEAQAREAQVQLALERVRARTMAMHQSDELAETASVVFKQLMNLGIEPNRIYIAIIKDETGIGEFWITDEDGSKVSSCFTADLNENVSFKKMYTGWKEQKKSITVDMQGKELEEYFKHLSSLNVPFKGGLSQLRRIQNIAYFSKGFIGVASPDETKPETIQLLERFAAVFNLTYTRFNDLQQAEEQNKIIQAENERKTQELEEARQLQLSMLPKELPQLPNLDIAVYMQTATEVGGDYYDFQVGLDGTLITVIGDATGHGMKAGTVVTITKSLFNSMALNENILVTFDKISQVLKGMKFRQLAMCLIMMKIKGNRLSISSAAMPPALIYRAKNKRIEELLLKGMPLGTMKKFPYKKIENYLDSGDRILLHSDGLPELANENNEMYGYERIKTEFISVGEKEPEEIVEHLKNSASQWANGNEPDDDVTFVVIKIK
jgi:hypothetical protein